jgi:hypothetical protein
VIVSREVARDMNGTGTTRKSIVENY